jgi:hypothetical protein
MKIRFMILLLVLAVTSGVAAQQPKEDYFSQVVATPDKTLLNFKIFVFHHKYRWVESKTEGKYSTVSIVVQNDKNAKPLTWEDYKIHFLLKDGTLFHNYATVAKSGNFACQYTVEPGQQHVQLICFGKKFAPENVERAWIKMTHTNFIRLLYNSKTFTAATGSGGTDPSTVSGSSSSMEQAKELLMKFLQPGADYNSMNKTLRPTQADYKAYFVEGSWQKAQTAYNQLWDQYPMAVKPKPTQTELLLWKASVEELKNGTGDSGQFPSGYKDIIRHIKPGHTIYRFKFVEPGKTIGMAFDGLVFINGHWVLIPKPWRVLK